MQAILERNKSLVLIVDDEAFNRQELRLALEQEGYQVAEAKNGAEAINVFRQTRPDLVIMDALMPQMDGFECCHKLLSVDSNKYTPVFMITVLEDKQSIDYAFQVGAEDYLIKPIHWPILRQRVKRSIEQSQLQQKLLIDNQQLQQLVNVDALTQVANRRRFDEYLSLEWQCQIRDQQPISFILCDVDFFKSYNDTYGHILGDRCLYDIAQAIKNVVQRPGDLVARYGGDEFAVILPHTNREGATYLAEKICFAVRSLAIPHENSQVNSYVTLSVGLSTLIPEPDSSCEEIIAAADLVMYQAKLAGRDRFLQ
ncbi:PleD family two-component system response regulator [Anabaena sphaerica FACHB-251]|uniref:PleD family two-component system response regulator n=1 Tax=Anabaena sphaerica FACHB-251 TaxID=2692883 RepID=A0A926WHT3_9NOST|nr:PleD family two-component system response regulator [Anabaena sphaerica]MBD2294340.1 PleD family two-component system response regulator [Anabaena sphaerica FACHB-251]